MNKFTILIVEDNTDKLKEIIQTIEHIDALKNLKSEDYIDHEIDGLGARKKMKEKNYDLLILDIAIPLRKSENIDAEGGLKLLDEILKREGYKIPIHIIGLTALEEIYAKASSNFASQILSVIKYSNTDIEWQSKLMNGVEQRITAKVSAATAALNYDYDIAIINAVETEFHAVKALSKDWNRVAVQSDSTSYFETTFSKDDKQFRVVAACAHQMGMNASAVLSLKMIHNFRPKYLFMTGIMASVKDITSHGYGDIIVADESWDGGAGKITEDENGITVFLPTANHIRLNTDISQKIRSIKDNPTLLRSIKDKWKPNSVPNTELTVHIGSVTSVAGVIENKAIIDELKKQDRKLLGLEMETFGMYYSAANCSHPKPLAAISLKSISDFANTSKNDLYQSYASYTSAQVMYEFIISEL